MTKDFRHCILSLYLSVKYGWREGGELEGGEGKGIYFCLTVPVYTPLHSENLKEMYKKPFLLQPFCYATPQ